MNRTKMLHGLGSAGRPWDILVIGGGATGLGCAVAAAARGYRTLLLERDDFSKATSSRSTKLAHGGIRYLRQGHFSLVFEALKERGLLMQNAPKLVRRLGLILPIFKRWERPFYGLGLAAYDLMAGKRGLGSSTHLTREQTLEMLPTLDPAGVRGGILFYDGQFDDARLALALVRTLNHLGGTPLNRMEVTGLLKAKGKVCGVHCRDTESDETYELQAGAVVNATGIFSDEVERLDVPNAPSRIALSQGTHLVLDRPFLPGDHGLLVPRTSDGRVLFALPWHGRVLVGTTDTPVQNASLEPRPLLEEIDFLLQHVKRFLGRAPTAEEVLSVFSGLRPLVARGRLRHTASLSRDHVVTVSPAGLVSIVGGKWTTYRKMGEDGVEAAVAVARLERHPPATAELELQLDAPATFGWPGSPPTPYDDLDLNELLHPRLPYRRGDVVWTVRHEMARSVEDVLARRTRALILDARASMSAAPEVATLMAGVLDRGADWQEQQVRSFEKLARGYVLS